MLPVLRLDAQVVGVQLGIGLVARDHPEVLVLGPFMELVNVVYISVRLSSLHVVLRDDILLAPIDDEFEPLADGYSHGCGVGGVVDLLALDFLSPCPARHAARELSEDLDSAHVTDRQLFGTE